jgi:hypothetical protein
MAGVLRYSAQLRLTYRQVEHTRSGKGIALSRDKDLSWKPLTVGSLPNLILYSMQPLMD